MFLKIKKKKFRKFSNKPNVVFSYLTFAQMYTVYYHFNIKDNSALHQLIKMYLNIGDLFE